MSRFQDLPKDAQDILKEAATIVSELREELSKANYGLAAGAAYNLDRILPYDSAEEGFMWPELEGRGLNG